MGLREINKEKEKQIEKNEYIFFSIEMKKDKEKVGINVR